MASNMSSTTDDKLKTAAQQGDINLLYTLIQEDPYILELIDSIPFVETPLHIAASAGQVQFATEIVRLKPSFALKLNQQGFSPIHLAMQHGQKRMVLRFVKINKDLVRVKGREGLTPLHFATQTGETDLLAKFLLACPDSIEEETVRGETALHIAVQSQQYEALQVLVGWLRISCRRGAMDLEKKILDWEDEDGNTILHISTLHNNSQALLLLVETNMDLQAKNFENSTALDMAESADAEIKSILIGARAKRGSSVTDAPTLADKLRSKITITDIITLSILRIRREISNDQRNAFLVVATLVATVTFQSALSPPGGVFQANAGDNNVNTTSLNSTATATPVNAGKSVMSEGYFFFLSIYNTISLLASNMIIYILIPSGTPSGTVGRLLLTPVSLYTYTYIVSMIVISPTDATSTLNLSMLFLVSIFYAGVVPAYRILQGNRGIEIGNGA